MNATAKKKRKTKIPKHAVKKKITKEDLVETEDGLKTKAIAKRDYKPTKNDLAERLQELDIDGDLYLQFLIENEDEQVAGRPRVYNPELHIPATISAMSRGASKQELCLELGVLPSYIWRWEKKYPAFAKAIEIGHALAEAWWRRKGRLNIHNNEFNNTLFMMNMQNRFNWKRKIDKNMHATAETISRKVMELEVNMKDLSDDDLRSIANILGGDIREPIEVEAKDPA